MTVKTTTTTTTKLAAVLKILPKMPKSDTFALNNPGAQWDEDTMGRGHNGTGAQ